MGYAYAGFSLSLVRHPIANALLYSALLVARSTVVAATALHAVPSTVSPQALHCRHLLTAGTGHRSPHAVLREFAFRLRSGAWRGEMTAGVLVFLVAFNEFDMASLMGVHTWTVALFDAHAGGLAPADSLRRLAIPFAVQACVLSAAAVALLRSRLRVRPAAPIVRRRVTPWMPPLLGAALGAVVPAAILLLSAAPAFGAPMALAAMGGDILASLGVAAAAAAVASLLAGRHTWPLATPGLFGSLVLALAVLSVLQLPFVRELRDTPVPLIGVLALLLWPSALVLRLLIAGSRPGAALFAARLLGHTRARRHILWHLVAAPRFAAAGILFVWAYWDVTAPAILSPPGISPAPLRLYNLMHYGRTPALSMMVCLAVSVPVLVLALLYPAAQWAGGRIAARGPARCS